ncbi:glycosyltransferase family 2 protein [Streptomyces sp. TG1A-8]|uniref:glycosyltransferase family 2 protein n=1 Tax=Streptomyces sp. TG1A-8 TaxID=3051385 RepID=UPI00265C24EA|nr:glycosyltransferase family 2 protein [Streptomyces sp. TG1A-8]MDO0927452.1 glycosyltransferase family 2 protein [Streptomyces sp. TG1A-8]
MPPDPPEQSPAPRAGVVVIGYNDAAHVADAVRSALAQGPAVGEVVAVDDRSTDGSAELLARLAAREPRLRVVRREANSGGCGSPRNTGADAVTMPYVMFLDSDDVLPPGAVDALLAAATGARAEVAGGLCVRRELPSGREQPWQASLYAAHAVLAHPSRRPRLVHDTLCVNKLYRTGFLREHGIRFPEGRFLYEDFVFGARVLAAAPRIALVPDRVYVWHVRRSAGRPSLSLDRERVDNWKARAEACALAHDILLDAGQKELARAARAKFLDHDLRMYARELGLRDAHYQRAWWAHTREHLARYDAADWASNPAAPGRLLARVVLASPEPRDLHRLRELAARPARLLPPYARAADGTPVWSADLPRVSLAPLLTRPAGLLPLAVDAELRPRARAARLRLRLHELYGRVAEAGPQEVVAQWHAREDGRVAQRATARFTPSGGQGARGTGDAAGTAGTADPVGTADAAGTQATDRTGGAGAGTWVAEVPVGPAALGAGTWDLRLTLRFADGTSRQVTAHARAGAGRLRRRAVPCARHGVLLVQPYATHSGALALRVATGVRGAVAVARGRLRRLLRRGRAARGTTGPRGRRPAGVADESTTGVRGRGPRTRFRRRGDGRT